MRKRNKSGLARISIACLVTFLGINMGVTYATSVPMSSSSETIAHAELVLSQGRYEEVINTLEQWINSPHEQDEAAQLARARLTLGAAYQGAGHNTKAISIYETALQAAVTRTDNKMEALITARLGGAYLNAARKDQARTFLQAALAKAQALQDETLEANIQNDLGNLFTEVGQYDSALSAYDKAQLLAQRAGDWRLAAHAALNGGFASLSAGWFPRAESNAIAAREYTKTSVTPGEQTRILLAVGNIQLAVAESDGNNGTLVKAAADAYKHAAKLADELRDPVLQSMATGELGYTYFKAGRHEDALELTRRAMTYAQEIQAPDLLLRWNWQAARLFKTSGAETKALDAYRRAAANYEQTGLISGYGGLRRPQDEQPSTLYLELADMLLKASAVPDDAHQRRDLLLEARAAIEHIKARELQDYFKDDCVARTRTQAKQLDQVIANDTAVLYPIVFDDRIELLLSHGDMIERHSVTVPAATVVATALAFRTSLQSQRTRAYQEHAQALYDWLIRPIEGRLSEWGVTTLVTVPDHVLRTVPIAALYDGKQFLIERLAVAIVPGLELTDPRPLPEGQAKTLLAGLTESVQGYPGLVNVGSELEGIHALFGGRTLLNEGFRRDRFQQELTGEHYAITHIASHGEFTGDVSQSFILTYDGKISVDELARYIGFNRFRDDPIDLLTLSACNTAAGDERAALGLAGITVKAGARSALASLWPIHDEATSILMTEFYDQLKNPGISKALALQRAQQKLGQITRYRHPGYWSSFVLIGSWL